MREISLKHKLNKKEIVEGLDILKEDLGLSWSWIAKRANVSRRTILRIQQSYRNGTKYEMTDEVRTKLSKTIQSLYKKLK